MVKIKIYGVIFLKKKFSVVLMVLLIVSMISPTTLAADNNLSTSEQSLSTAELIVDYEDIDKNEFDKKSMEKISSNAQKLNISGVTFEWVPKQGNDGYLIVGEEIFDTYETFKIFVKCADEYKYKTITVPGVYLIEQFQANGKTHNIDMIWIGDFIDYTPVKGTITGVNLITDKEIEICFDAPVKRQNTKLSFTVLVDGQEVDYDYLSYFDFGPYAAQPRVNVRLKEPLDVGTLSGRTGTAVTPLSGTSSTLGPIAADRISVIATATGQKYADADWVPFYSYRQLGQKSKIHATGTAKCNTLAANSLTNTAYNAEYVINYCGEGINKMVGRAETLTLNAVEKGLCVRIVGPDQSVYEAPEYRELYNPADYKTRTHIAGTLDKPIIVTTADDVMRQASTGEMNRPKSDRFYMGEAFLRLYWTLGVKEGCPRTPLSVYNDPDDYRYDKHIEAAYEHAKANNLWPGTKMMDSVEDYFTYAGMVWYEFIPESPDGKWYPEAFPVNTRAELKEYDPDLFRPMVGVFGEFEYFSGLSNQTFNSGNDTVRSHMPWFWHCQVDNYGIDDQAYEPLAVEHCWVIANDQIELKFNREVKDITAATTASNWRVYRDGQQLTGVQIRGAYVWKSITLQVSNLTVGAFGRDFRGFTQQDIDERKVSAGGWIADTEVASATALQKGEFVGLDEAIARGAGLNGVITVEFVGNTDVCDWAGNKLEKTTHTTEFHPWMGNAYRSPLTGFYVYADTGVSKETMEIAALNYDTSLSNSQTITYDKDAGGNTKVVNYDRIGQRVADGAVKRGGGMQIIASGQHAMQQPTHRNQQNSNYHTGLYVEGWGGTTFQDEEDNILRDYSLTRYKNEYLVAHEGGHGLDSFLPTYANEVYNDISAAHSAATSIANGRRWFDENNVGAYCSSRGEYTSTLSTFWHTTMRESKDGTNDGTWTPCNTREELYRYDPWGYEVFKRIFYNGDVGLWYCDEQGNHRVGDPAYKVLASDWQLLAQDEDLKARGFEFKSEDDVIKWGCTFPETLANNPYTGYSNPKVKWLSWSVPNIYNIGLKGNPNNPNCQYDFKGYDSYYPENPTKSYANPFLSPPYVKRPVRPATTMALLAPVEGVAGELSFLGGTMVTFDFATEGELSPNNAAASFSLKVDCEPMDFTFVSYEDGIVTLLLDRPLEDGAEVTLTVTAKGQSVSGINAPAVIESAADPEPEVDKAE